MSNWSISSSVHRSPSASRRGLTNKHTIYSAPEGTCIRFTGTFTPRRAESSSAVERCPIALVQSIVERRARASFSDRQVLVIASPGVVGYKELGKAFKEIRFTTRKKGPEAPPYLLYLFSSAHSRRSFFISCFTCSILWPYATRSITGAGRRC